MLRLEKQNEEKKAEHTKKTKNIKKKATSNACPKKLQIQREVSKYTCEKMLEQKSTEKIRKEKVEAEIIQTI